MTITGVWKVMVLRFVPSLTHAKKFIQRVRSALTVVGSMIVQQVLDGFMRCQTLLKKQRAIGMVCPARSCCPTMVLNALKMVVPLSNRLIVLVCQVANLSDDMAMVRVLVSMICPNAGFTSCMRLSAAAVSSQRSVDLL